MIIKEPGHIYQFLTLDMEKHNQPEADEVLRFVNREGNNDHAGTQTQEVLRALIDRTMHCDNCISWQGNPDIIHYMRMAIAYHEARALERKAEKGLYLPELVSIAADGHFQLAFDSPSEDNKAYNKRRYGNEDPRLRRP